MQLRRLYCLRNRCVILGKKNKEGTTKEFHWRLDSCLTDADGRQTLRIEQIF